MERQRALTSDRFVLHPMMSEAESAEVEPPGRWSDVPWRSMLVAVSMVVGVVVAVEVILLTSQLIAWVVVAGFFAVVLAPAVRWVESHVGGRRSVATGIVVFSDGRGALIPAIPGFIASLTYEQDEDGELANITYEPSDNTANWAALQAELPTLRELRGVIAAATRLGVFRPDDAEDQVRLIDRLRRAKGLDPSMALYAAYALHALAQRDAIAQMQRDLKMGIGLTLFDVAMLASAGRQQKAHVDADVFPAVPLLSQGWALLDAFAVALPPSLEGKLFQHLESSLWTLFKPEGVQLIQSAITTGEIV